jgi:hypothetical protein
MNDQEWSEQQPHAVYVAGIHVPFWSVVGFMVKWSIAFIPAAIILFLVSLVFDALFIMLLIGLFYYFHPSTLTSLMGIFHNFVPGLQSQ